eukprot:6170025-Prymnesium_polylepis.2
MSGLLKLKLERYRSRGEANIDSVSSPAIQNTEKKIRRSQTSSSTHTHTTHAWFPRGAPASLSIVIHSGRSKSRRPKAPLEAP